MANLLKPSVDQIVFPGRCSTEPHRHRNCRTAAARLLSDDDTAGVSISVPPLAVRALAAIAAAPCIVAIRERFAGA